MALTFPHRPHIARHDPTSMLSGRAPMFGKNKTAHLFPRRTLHLNLRHMCYNLICATRGSARTCCEDRWQFIAWAIRMLIWTCSITNSLRGISAASRRNLVETLRMSRRWVPHGNSVNLIILVRKILIETSRMTISLMYFRHVQTSTLHKHFLIFSLLSCIPICPENACNL